MVSTRGGTRTQGADANLDVTTRKKPVRKEATKPAPAATKAKTTRSKKAEPTSEQLDDDEEDDISVAIPPTKTSRRAQAPKPDPSTKRATTRAKIEDEPSTKTTSKPATRTTAAASSKSIVKAKAVKDDKPDLPPPSRVQAAGSRATRATRATSAKERAPPLSPKKITQVTRAPPKTTRTAAKAKAQAPTVQSKPATRKRRNVSDENADVLAKDASEDIEPELAAHKRGNQVEVPETKPTSPVKSKLSIIEDETPASSRPTTPSDGVGQSFDVTEDEASNNVANEDTEPDDEDEDEALSNSSQDELCGPKTPMKRPSPWASLRKNRREADIGIPSKTPVKRFAVLGTQQGTPQTTKPYRKPSAPVADLGAMTVARARDRAMVFPKLAALTLDTNNFENDQPDLMQEETSSLHASDDHDMLIEEQDTPQWQAQSPEQEDTVMSEDDTAQEVLDNSVATAQTPDPDETTLADAEETAHVQNRAVETSFESDDSVIITRQESPLSSESEHNEDFRTTPRAETLVWENIRQDVTIPFNFDIDMTLSASLPEVEHSDRLSVAESFVPTLPNEDTVVAGVILDDETLHQGTPSIESSRVVVPDQTTVQNRQSLDATVNLSDFIDLRLLSESRRQSRAVDEHTDQHSDKLHAAESSLVEEEGLPAEKPATLAEDLCESGSTVDADDGSAHEIVLQTPAELETASAETHDQAEPSTPRYALSTISSRRKSLPAKLLPGTLSSVGEGVRPRTSDGAGIAAFTTPARSPARMKSALSRPITALGSATVSKVGKAQSTPSASRTPQAKTPGTSVPFRWNILRTGDSSVKTPTARALFANTPATSVPHFESIGTTERFPTLPPRLAYEVEAPIGSPAALENVEVTVLEHQSSKSPTPNESTRELESPATVDMQVSAATPVAKSASEERYPGLPPKESYEDQVEASVHTDSGDLTTPRAAAAERYPGLPHRRTYEEHANTAMPVTRFRTPVQRPTKRPATVQKQASLRKLALVGSTPGASRTPVKTPLKAPAFTPGQVPMTPHPAAPLRGVVALVEVYTSDGDCATPAFAALLQRLGAKTTKTFSDRVTHVVYKEGSPNTLQRLRIHNKEVLETGLGTAIHCVNSRWVTDCDANGMRMEEADEAYAVEVDDVPRTAKRRRKSMEPMALTNIGGSVHRERKSSASLSRSSSGRLLLKSGSPLAEGSMLVDMEGKENSCGEGSPATPAYLAAPTSLIQQTAPLNKVRKLDFKAQEGAKNRRLTFWNGGA